jgi:hypothetical protein
MLRLVGSGQKLLAAGGQTAKRRGSFSVDQTGFFAASRLLYMQQTSPTPLGWSAGTPGVGPFFQSASVGLALHLAEVLYGNIGSGNRLDFTCIGPAVNLAARLEKLAASSPLPRREPWARQG